MSSGTEGSSAALLSSTMHTCGASIERGSALSGSALPLASATHRQSRLHSCMMPSTYLTPAVTSSMCFLLVTLHAAS